MEENNQSQPNNQNQPNQTPVQNPGSVTTSNQPNPSLRILVIVGCFVFGLIQIVIPAFQLIFVIPKLNSLYQNLNIKPSPISYLGYVLMGVLILLGIINTFFAVKLIKNPSYFKRAVKLFFISMIGVGLIVSAIMYSVINPIYNLVNQIDSPPQSSQTNQITPYSSTVPDPTANWKTYENSKYYYSVEFPQQYKAVIGGLLTDAKGDEASFDLVYAKKEPGAPGYPFFYINVIEPGDQKNIVYNNDGFTQSIKTGTQINVGEKLSPQNQSYGESFTRLPDENVNDNVFTVYEADTGGKPDTGKDRRLVITHNGLIYVIGTYYFAEPDKNYHQILSTFKFTQPTGGSNDDKTTIKALVSQKSNIPLDKVVITYDPVGKFGSDYVSGNVSQQDTPGSGAKWFAAKINDTWTVVWVGNGMPKCADVAQFNLPQGFVVCY